MLIKNMLEDLGDTALETPVPIPNVSSLQPHSFTFGYLLIIGTGERVGPQEGY